MAIKTSLGTPGVCGRVHVYSLLGAVRVRLFDLEVETGGAPDGLSQPLGQKPGLPLSGIHVVFHGILSAVVHCKQTKNTQWQREGTVFSSSLVHLDQIVITGMILIICFSDVYNMLRSYNGINTCTERLIDTSVAKPKSPPDVKLLNICQI